MKGSNFLFGILITGFAFYLLLACVAYLFWWKTDQSLPDSDIVSGPDIAVKNWSGKSGHFLAKMIISNGFGFGAFFIPLIFGTIGLISSEISQISNHSSLLSNLHLQQSSFHLFSVLSSASQTSILEADREVHRDIISHRWLNAFMGMIGTGVVLAFITISYLIFALKVKPESFGFKITILSWIV